MDDASGFTMAAKYFNYAGEYQFYLATDDKLYWVIYDDSVGSYGAFEYIYTAALTSLQGQWVNGVVQSVTTATYDTYVAMENTTLPLQMGKLNNGYANGKIATLQLYKKELSSAEVLQNYNALKDRFI